MSMVVDVECQQQNQQFMTTNPCDDWWIDSWMTI